MCVVAVCLVLTDTLQTMRPLQGLAAQWACGSAWERATYKLVAITVASNCTNALPQLPFPLFLLFPLSVSLFLLLFFTILTLEQKHDREVVTYKGVLLCIRTCMCSSIILILSHPPMHRYLYPFIHPSTYPSLSIQPSFHPSIHLYIHPSIQLSIICQFVHPSIHPSIHLSTHPFIHQLIHTSIIHLSLFLNPLIHFVIHLNQPSIQYNSLILWFIHASKHRKPINPINNLFIFTHPSIQYSMQYLF